MFCLSKSELKNLWLKKHRERISTHIKKFDGLLSFQEMYDQMLNESGPFYDSVTKDTNSFANKTVNVEVLMSFDLSDFYFGEKTDASICFGMKSDFSGSSVSDYNELIANIASATYVDCCIKFAKQKYKFQIKRYPGKYREYSNEAILDFLRQMFKEYGNMKGTNFVLLLQPSSVIENPFNFKKLHGDLNSKREEITFDEIFLILNDQNQRLLLGRVFPDYVFFEKPLRFASEKYRELQKEMKNKI